MNLKGIFLIKSELICNAVLVSESKKSLYTQVVYQTFYLEEYVCILYIARTLIEFR